MADVAQVYTVVNTVAKQAFGQDAVSVVDTSTLVALGDKVMESDKDKEAFNSALSDVIGRTIISIRVYNGDNESMVRHAFEYGMALRKIYVEVGDAEVNNSWNIGKDTYTPEFAPIKKPIVNEHLFSNISTYEFGVTIPDDLWATAFHRAEEMGALIDGIFVAMELRLQTSLHHLNNLVRASFIARKYNAGGIHAINLLADYNTETGNKLLAKDALRDKEFIRWSNMIMGMFVDRLVLPSRMFNTASYLRHTPKDLQVFTVLANYARASEMYLQSDTYHDALVKMPFYTTVPYWQGSGKTYAFDDVSQVNVKLTASGTATVIKGVLAILYDYEAMGTMIDKPRSPVERNNHDEYTNYYNKVNRGYFNDLSENAVMFYIADPTTPPTPPTEGQSLKKTARKK